MTEETIFQEALARSAEIEPASWTKPARGSRNSGPPSRRSLPPTRSPTTYWTIRQATSPRPWIPSPPGRTRRPRASTHPMPSAPRMPMCLAP